MSRPIHRTAPLVLLAALLAHPLRAQEATVGTGGAVLRAQDARLAGGWRRVLMIGAHPDDEDTELLTVLSRGHGVATAYLSLTRGEGGQNLIGAELGRALGVIRSEELLAARALDGGAQFFTRAFDFGFSKSAAETFRFWPQDSVIKDVVRIIRRLRPQVIVSVWTGTPADGHGHHQASGIVAKLAWEAAGDSTRFPELRREEGLAPYQPAKFYRGGWVDQGKAPLTFDGGALDPAVGQSYRQIAVRSRSRHRSQGEGGLQNLGPSAPRVFFEAAVPGIAAGAGLFDGVPVEPGDHEDGGPADRVTLADGGVIVDAVADDDDVVPGQVVGVTLTVWNAGRDTVRAEATQLRLTGYSARLEGCVNAIGAVAPGTVKSCRYEATVWEGATPTVPYYTLQSPQGALYRWTASPELRGLPFEPPLQARFTVTLAGGRRAVAIREVTFRALDPTLGEVRRPVQIVPRVALDLSPDVMLWRSTTTSRPFQVALEHFGRDTATVDVSLIAPPGWRTGAPQRVTFAREGERATVEFVVARPAVTPPGDYEFRAIAVSPDGRDTMRLSLFRIRHRHIRARNLATVASASVTVADVAFTPQTATAYVRGAADRIPEAMRNTGIPLREVGGTGLATDSLGRYRTIVIGPRAYETDPGLAAVTPRLLRWVEQGGTLIIQYQQYAWARSTLPPLPLTIAQPHDRVTDEQAPVRLLAPAHRLFAAPNRITDRDFADWRQERGLYFARSWDPAWTPLLESHDEGDAPREGGLLVARLGRGTVIYTGLAFFRQLPAAVPGAWRIWANLLAVRGAP